MKKLLLILLYLAGSVNATTYYVKPAGSDAANGTSWSTAWKTLTNVNDTTKFTHGDTGVFGTGVWRDAPLYTIAGTAGDRTCYADSLHHAGTYGAGRVAWIYASDSLSGWTQIAGNVYIVTHTPASSYPGIFQDDSLMYGQADSASVNAAGEWWYGNGHIVAYAYGGGDPDSYDVEIIRPQKCLEIARAQGLYGQLYGQDYVTVLGLGFKNAGGRMIGNDAAGYNDVNYLQLRHCYLSNNVGWAGINPSLIFTSIPQQTTNSCYYWRITACSLTNCYAWNSQSVYPQTEVHVNSDGMNFYSLYNSVIDSNTFFGHIGTTGLYFKCAAQGASGAGSVYDTVRFNLFSGGDIPVGLRLWGSTHHVSVYGNIFKSTSILICYGSVPASAQGDDIEGHHKIWNNTFYNAGVEQSDSEDRGYAGKHFGNFFQYNVIYQSTGATVLSLDSLRFWEEVDSNLYFAASGTNDWVTPTSRPYTHTHNTFAQWQARGVDTLSTDTVNPGFDSVNASNPWNGLARSGASGEMYQIRAGDTWTRYGALQENVPCLVTQSLSATAVFKSSATVIDDYWYDPDSTLSKLKLVWDTNNVVAGAFGADSITSSFTDPDSLNLTGLTPGTQYWAWAILSRGSCSPDTSAFCSFTTVATGTGGHCKIKK